MDWITDPEIWVSLLTLTALEIVLGIDNLVFIAILAGRLPAEQQNRARQIGLALALLTRLALLASIAWIIGLTQPLFRLLELQGTGPSGQATAARLKVLNTPPIV
jgi:predicted tellurium resistance membrane protein TerC